jgi:hypothetical protein
MTTRRRGAYEVGSWAVHSEAVLHAHYKELVREEEAKRFWELMPRKKK